VIYGFTAIPDSSVPRAHAPEFDYLLQTYASESNKVASVWSSLGDEHLDWRPHPKASTTGDIIRHQLLSERRFFGEFMSTPEPPPAVVLPVEFTVQSAITRFVELASARLPFFAAQDAPWWFATVPFFDTERQRIWVFWRRILHTAHHRTQLTVYLRLLDLKVPSTYGPSADVTWTGADPTHTIEAAGRP
jgi:hypothetical protein